MLTIDDYKKISRFKDILHRYHFLNKDYDAFRKLACAALDDLFGFHHILFGYLNYPKKKETSLQILVHNTPEKLVERFFMSGILSDGVFRSDEDIALFSQMENFRKRTVYRDLLLPYGYTDFMICYLPLNDAYVGYLLIFRDKAQKSFAARDVEILREIYRYLAEEYYNFLRIVQLNNSNRLLISHSNHYPMGVVIMQNMMTVAYANETAREYMQELGTSPQFFSVFYSNQLVPYIKNDLLHLGNRQIVRYQNFIFSVVITNVLTEGFFEGMERARKDPQSDGMINYTPDATGYIYILRDDVSTYIRKGDPFEEYDFTKRERQVAALLLRGKVSDEIASELSVSPNTVKVHIQKLYRKANVSSRAEFLFLMNQHTGK